MGKGASRGFASSRVWSSNPPFLVLPVSELLPLVTPAISPFFGRLCFELRATRRDLVLASTRVGLGCSRCPSNKPLLTRGGSVKSHQQGAASPAEAVSGQKGKQPPNSSKSSLHPPGQALRSQDPGVPGSWGRYSPCPSMPRPVVWDLSPTPTSRREWGRAPRRARGWAQQPRALGTPQACGDRGWPGGVFRAPASAILGHEFRQALS